MKGRDPQHEQTWGGNAGWVVFALAIAAVPVFGALAMMTVRMGPPAIAIWGIAAWGGAMIFRGPIGQAIARSISGPSAAEGQAEVPPELYAELDELRARVGELEERVDFSERLLTQNKGLES